jgi:peptide deformylase
MEEGCLSVLGHDGLPVYANVTRPSSVVVEWTDERGENKMAEMHGLPARIVQHETDHLDGKLFVDYLSPLRREMLMRKVKRLKI